MILIALGVAAAGLFAIRRMHRYHAYAYGHGGCGPSWHWHHHHRMHRMHGMHRHGYGPGYGPGHGGDGDDFGGDDDGMPPLYRLRWVYQRLQTTPGQERVIQMEAKALWSKARELRRGLKGGRADLGRAIGGADFDGLAAEAALGRGDAAWAELRTQATESLKKIHEVLDPEQRAKVAKWLGADGTTSKGPFR